LRYEINAGRLLTWALEAHLVDHCNLRCTHCCTLSPQLPARVTPPGDLARDLARAARVLRPRTFKLTGGEPLLHPDILACLDAARASGIADTLSVTTNGLRLDRMPDGFFERIDRLTLSWYPRVRLDAAVVARVVDRCRAHDVALTVKRIDRFGRMDPEGPLSEAEARSIHAACWLKQRCHLLHEGRFYACTRPPHLARLRGDSALAAEDGIDLDDDDASALARRLRLYLEAETPLASCRLCLGASGERVPHRQEPTAASRADRG